LEAVLKKIKKNHIIITALAIMIAAAGYINYAGDLDNIIKVKDKEKTAAVAADNVSTDNNEAEAADTDFTDEPGTVILTSAGVKSEAVAAAKLNREQVRASSIENLKSIADDAGIADDAKKSAIDQLAKLECRQRNSNRTFIIC
jgi:stage III sporulation protein AH